MLGYHSQLTTLNHAVVASLDILSFPQLVRPTSDSGTWPLICSAWKLLPLCCCFPILGLSSDVTSSEKAFMTTPFKCCPQHRALFSAQHCLKWTFSVTLFLVVCGLVTPVRRSPFLFCSCLYPQCLENIYGRHILLNEWSYYYYCYIFKCD